MDALKTVLWLTLILSAAAMSQDSFGRGGHGGSHASCNHGSSHHSGFGIYPYPYGYGYSSATPYSRTYPASCAEYPELPECSKGNTPVVPLQNNNAPG